jgi:hypothetical protein
MLRLLFLPRHWGIGGATGAIEIFNLLGVSKAVGIVLAPCCLPTASGVIEISRTVAVSLSNEEEEGPLLPCSACYLQRRYLFMMALSGASWLTLGGLHAQLAPEAGAGAGGAGGAHKLWNNELSRAWNAAAAGRPAPAPAPAPAAAGAAPSAEASGVAREERAEKLGAEAAAAAAAVPEPETEVVQPVKAGGDGGGGAHKLWNNDISRAWSAVDEVYRGFASKADVPRDAQASHCWNCGGVGHVKSKCPYPPSGLTKGQIRRRRKFANRRPAASIVSAATTPPLHRIHFSLSACVCVCARACVYEVGGSNRFSWHARTHARTHVRRTPPPWSTPPTPSGPGSRPSSPELTRPSRRRSL